MTKKTAAVATVSIGGVGYVIGKLTPEDLKQLLDKFLDGLAVFLKQQGPYVS